MVPGNFTGLSEFIVHTVYQTEQIPELELGY